eukprot:jgi/Chlat1/4181/Chrsp27S08876
MAEPEPSPAPSPIATLPVDDGQATIRFRMPDGTDIGPIKYAQNITVLQLKESAVANWPKDKEAPKSTQDVKLILAGKVLENNKTVNDAKVPFGAAGAGVVTTMHLVVRPPASPKDSGELLVCMVLVDGGGR